MTSAGVLHLRGRDFSLVLERAERGPPLWRHWGAPIDPADLPPLADMRGPASFSMDRDVPLSSAPTGGGGWFGPAALACHRGGQNSVIGWQQCDIVADAGSIAITLTDAARGVRLVQHIRCGADAACATFSATITNIGDDGLSVTGLASAVLPLPARAAGIRSYHGRHNAELQCADEAMPAQIWRRTSRRGLTGHGGPPGLFVREDGAGEHHGGVWAVQLAWSGDSDLAVEADDEGGYLLSAAAVLHPAELALAAGESWTAPDLLATFSRDGLGGAARNFHAAIRARMDWPGGAMRPRAVHFNSWEACYFAHDEAAMMALADRAAALGVERFVLDDGWFRGRDHDRAGLGDWTVDARKYPDGLGRLAQHITGLGMEFGLWVEPEMVNPDSDLFRAHPDWALAVDGIRPPTARHQLVLDMGRGEVQDHLFAALDALLTDLPIAYLKWDHNRDLSPAADVAGGPRRCAQVAGSYALLARLRAAHPQVEIESCAGGGGRIDAGVLRHTHRFWTSDNIDALSRLPIQRGFLAFMPPELMGSHVGAAPAHATGRSQRLGFRAAVAMTGYLGVEMDPATLDTQGRDELADWIDFYKRHRALLHSGDVWQGDGGDGLLWQAHGQDGNFLLFTYQCTPPQRRRPQPLPLPFVSRDPQMVQLVKASGLGSAYRLPLPPMFAAMEAVPQHWSGDWLRHAGLPLPPIRAEGAAVFQIKSTD
jgi:alpha-galactosidase